MNLLHVFQIILSVFLVVFVLVQTKGGGITRSWKGPTSFTRRGLERIIFRSTFVISLLFVLVSILQIVL